MIRFSRGKQNSITSFRTDTTHDLSQRQKNRCHNCDPSAIIYLNALILIDQQCEKLFSLKERERKRKKEKERERKNVNEKYYLSNSL